MFRLPERGAAVGVALAFVTLTAGCIGGLAADGSLDAEAVGDRVEQRYAALDGYSATVTRTVEAGDETTVASASVAVDRGDERRVTYQSGPRAGETVVASADAGPVFDTGVTGGGAATAAQYGALAEALVDASNVSVDRVTTYDGHRTAVVTFAPAANASDVTRTVWVDLDRRVPLRVTTSWTTADGTEVDVTVTYDDVTLYDNEQAASAEVAT